MEPPGGRDSRFNLSYSMNLLSGETAPEIYGNPNSLVGGGGGGRPSTSLQQLSPRHTMVSACGGVGGGGGGGGGRSAIKSDVCDDYRGMTSQALGGGGMDACGGVNDMSDDAYNSLQVKKSPPSNGKKTKGRVKIKMEYIENKLRRYTTFSKRKTGIMKKAYELSTLTGTQVMLLVASETGHVYTFATRKLQPMITSEAGKALIQTCLNSPDPPAGAASGGDQRMSATGFEETELTYNISDEDSKDENMSTVDSSADSSDGELQMADAPPPPPPSSEPITFRIPTTTSPIITPTSSSAKQQSTTSSTTSASQSRASTAGKASKTSSTASTTASTTTTASKTTNQQITIGNGVTISPLLYQTPQGMMYATPTSNGNMIFSLAGGSATGGGGGGGGGGRKGDPTLGQFITIPLSVMTASGQGELDLSAKRK